MGIFEVFVRPPTDPVMARDMPILSSPLPVTFILLCYLLFVLKLGKMFMEHRTPYNLKNIILVYNFCQMIYNAILFYYGIYLIILKPVYDIRCIIVLRDDHPMKGTERMVAYTYFLNKILDLLDTIFFVLRKSYKQITFLHVYHHVMMVYTTYWVIHFYGCAGQFTVMGTLNTFVHTVMYFYYFTSAMYPELKGSLWWKKYITKIQILQFVILIIQSLAVLLLNPSCTFPIILQYLQLFQATVMIIMFVRFYIQSYVKPKQKII
ncbi:elongation of very long chain fatty acids protein F-like [Drosophila novamexicana]|uniref:elongation of very long chain fatty acids protein F-like n=1 Tax=Drosophila novamexicana TaxID=47314 RepID=UPI0011E5A95E|nr:elongation of very long chain fatty acids protein F-like [Drosophila novamexicana]